MGKRKNVPKKVTKKFDKKREKFKLAKFWKEVERIKKEPS